LSHGIEELVKTDARGGSYADEGAVNMRDLSRFLNLYQNFRNEASPDSALI